MFWEHKIWMKYSTLKLNHWQSITCTEGTRNLFKTVKHAQDLLENDETEFEIFKKKFFNNSYFMHIEMVIIGLLSDKEMEKRQIGMDLVNEARQQELQRMNNPQRYVLPVFFPVILILRQYTLSENENEWRKTKQVQIPLSRGASTFFNAKKAKKKFRYLGLRR